MSDRIADQSGLSGSIYSSPQAKEEVMKPGKNDTYNSYWNSGVSVANPNAPGTLGAPKPITEMTINQFFQKLFNTLQIIWNEVINLWMRGNRNWRDYWTIITKHDRLIYVGIFLVTISFLLYLFFS